MSNILIKEFISIITLSTVIGIQLPAQAIVEISIGTFNWSGISSYVEKACFPQDDSGTVSGTAQFIIYDNTQEGFINMTLTKIKPGCSSSWLNGMTGNIPIEAEFDKNTFNLKNITINGKAEYIDSNGSRGPIYKYDGMIDFITSTNTSPGTLNTFQKRGTEYEQQDHTEFLSITELRIKGIDESSSILGLLSLGTLGIILTLKQKSKAPKSSK